MKLEIVIKKKYFDEISKGTKTEEYRLTSPYWKKKLIGREYDYILFRNGYGNDRPCFKIEYLGYEIKTIIHEFFGSKPVEVFVIQLGKKIE